MFGHFVFKNMFFEDEVARCWSVRVVISLGVTIR